MKTKRLSIVLSLLLALSVFVACIPDFTNSNYAVASTVDRTFDFDEELEGKLFVFYGDSITARYGLKYNAKDYTQMLREEYGFYSDNLAVGGATWTGSKTGNTVSRQLEKSTVLYREADYVSFFFGTNDCNFGVELGTSNSAHNTGSVCGAIMYALDTIIEANPDVKIMLITPFYNRGFHYGYGINNKSGYSLDDVRNAIIEIGTAYNCKIADIKDVINDTNADKYLQSDNLHISEQGYRAMVDCIVSQ